MNRFILIPLIVLLITGCAVTKNNNQTDIRVYGNALQKTEKYYGNAFEPDSVKMVIEKAFEFSVYLTKDKEKRKNAEMIFKSENSLFDFTIPANKLKKNKYLLFENPDHFTYIKIASIDSELKDFVIDYHPVMIAKPAIYLYPTKEQKITITHRFKGQLLNTYPKYVNGWNVIAKPNGELLNIFDNRKYNYLFWDGTYNFPIEHYNFKTGFEIKKSELIDFLQEKLEIIGLNNTEINDFIVYWLPVLSKNKINFIHFRINDNIDNISFLDIEPKPDTEIRLFMEFKEINEIKQIPEQNLTRIDRKGFTMIEWGGTNIGNEKIECREKEVSHP